MSLSVAIILKIDSYISIAIYYQVQRQDITKRFLCITLLLPSWFMPAEVILSMLSLQKSYEFYR